MRDSEFMSAKEKDIVLKQWKTFLRALKACNFEQRTGADYGDFPTSLGKPFTKRLYQHLHVHCNFIAHYNRYGFLAERFGSPDNCRETIRELSRTRVLYDYQDLHDAMMKEVVNA